MCEIVLFVKIFQLQYTLHQRWILPVAKQTRHGTIYKTDLSAEQGS